MLLIANSTGGRLPKFWRPPYGDTDVRVSAIAREVSLLLFSFNIYAYIYIELLLLRLGVQSNSCSLES